MQIYALVLFCCLACRWPFSTPASAEGDSDDNVSNGAAHTVALTCVTATNTDGQGACGAEGGRPTVNY